MTANRWFCMECDHETLPMDAGEMRAHLRQAHGIPKAYISDHALTGLVSGEEAAAVYSITIYGGYPMSPHAKLCLYHYEATPPFVAFAEIGGR